MHEQQVLAYETTDIGSAFGYGLHHVQLAIPPGAEPQCREFYVDLLGLSEIMKPPALQARGGLWVRADRLEIHLGVEQDFHPARKAHPGILVADPDAEAVTGTGADPAIADLVARALVDAERRGHPSHGVALLPTYLARAAAGGIDPHARPRLTEVTKGVAVIDAGGGYGQSAADLAAQWCAERARDVGVAAVAVRNNNHVGMLAAYRWPFQRSGTVGMLLNISGPSVAPPDGLRPTLGSNAVCMVVPLGDNPHSEPFCVDFATGVVAAGKVRDAANRGESIPDHWLLDKYGRPTTDPAALDNDGAVPLFGNYKGLCVTLIAEMLGGAMAGGVVSPSVGKQRAHPEAPMRCSQLFVAFSLQHFGRTDVIAPLQQLREAVAAAYDTPPMRPWFPDQAEADHAERTDTTGVHLPDAVIQQLGWEWPDR